MCARCSWSLVRRTSACLARGAPRAARYPHAAAFVAARSSSSASTTIMMNLNSADAAAFRTWLDGIDDFLVDCDGVLWRGNDGVPGVADTVKTLRALGKRVFFVTNNSTKSRADYVHKLHEAAGIDCAAEDIISSAFAASVYCKREGIKKAYVIGQSGLVKELQDIAGVESLGPEDWGKEFSFGTFNPATHLDADVQAVVIGFDNRFTYYKLATAAMYLRTRPEVRFVATNADASYPDTYGFVPGGGSLVAALQTGSGRKADIVAGKPNPVLLDLIESAKGLTRARTCMVGDRLDTDILFGNGGGLGASLLVLTGVSSLADAGARPEGDPHRPTHYVDSFGSIGALAKASGMA